MLQSFSDTKISAISECHILKAKFWPKDYWLFLLSTKRSNINRILITKMSFFYNWKNSKSSTFAVKFFIVLAVKMESFRIIKPSPALVPYIRYYWILRIDEVTPVRERTLPVGCVHMVFHRGRQLFSLTEKSLQPTAFISGQSTT